MKRYSQEKEVVLNEMQSNAEQGLSVAEAEKRLEQNGKNRLKEGKKKSIARRFLEQLADPMIIILIVAAAISGALTVYESIESGKSEFPTDVIIILAVVLINAVLGVFQESKAEKAIEALQKMSAATSKVIRDGKLTVVHSEDLVVGDIVLLEAGDAVPADGRVLESASLQVEEAPLTGESVPVSKVTEAIYPKDGAQEVTLGDRKNMVYMGSTVVYGRGVVVVTATGMDTEMGKIADALSQAQEGKTPLQRKLAQLSKVLTWLVLGISIVVFGVQLIRAGGFSWDTTIHSFMIAVSLAVAAIPEGLAAVVTVVLSIGVTNMSKRNAIIRKLTAVETLGCAQIICSDKTGTLTQNKMTVVKSFGEDEKRVATGMALCSDAEVDENGEVTGEPTEAALVAWAYKLELPKYDLKKVYPRVAELPFDSSRKMMSTLHPVGNAFVQYTKGAPDVILDRCSHCVKDGKTVPMTAELKEEILQANKDMADNALRVLACAERNWDSLPETLDSEGLERDMYFTGLCGMIDPVRPEVKVAIEECREAGIRPIMITGDHVDTAVAIAKELGILTEDARALTGAQLNELSDEEFEKIFQTISVYARVQPEHKTRIVNAWKKYGFVTAMTGDGVNDAPSIKSADIGVGMGITGTDVTKNVADMVLTDDNFATIVGAVEEGRRIYDNIRKAIQFLLASNMSEVIAIFVATIMGVTLLQPVHLLWINLVTDTFPALALGVEKAEKDVMKRKPRDSKAGVFADGMGFDVVYQGLLVAILVLVSFFVGHYIQTGNWEITDSTHGTTMAFLTLAMAEIFHSLNMRSQRKSLFAIKQQNLLLWLAALGSFVLSVAVCAIPPVAGVFGFTPIGWGELGLAILIGFMIIPIVEIVKLVQRALEKKKEKSNSFIEK